MSPTHPALKPFRTLTLWLGDNCLGLCEPWPTCIYLLPSSIMVRVRPTVTVGHLWRGVRGKAPVAACLVVSL